MLQTDHVIDPWVARQQLPLDTTYGMLDDSGHALHRGSDGENVPRSDRPVRIAVAAKGIAGERRQGYGRGRHRKIRQGGRLRHAHPLLLYPTTRRNVLTGQTNDAAVANHRCAGRNVLQSNLVSLRDGLARHETLAQPRTFAQTCIDGHDGDVVVRMHLHDRRLSRGPAHDWVLSHRHAPMANVSRWSGILGTGTVPIQTNVSMNQYTI